MKLVIYGVLLACWAAMTAAHAQSPESRSHSLRFNQFTPKGCFGSLGLALSVERTHVFNCVGYCTSRCAAKDKPVAAMKDRTCFCGDIYPSRVAQVEEDKCSIGCPGYPMDMCGGPDSFSVWSQGTEENDIEFEDDAGDETSSVSDSEWGKITDAAGSFSSAAGGWGRKIQDFFSKCLGRAGSNPTKQASSGQVIMGAAELKV